MATLRIENNLGGATPPDFYYRHPLPSSPNTPVKDGNSAQIPGYDYSDYFFNIDGPRKNDNAILFSSKMFTHGIELIDEVDVGNNNMIIRIAPVPAFGNISDLNLPDWRVESCKKNHPTEFDQLYRNTLNDVFLTNQLQFTNPKLNFNVTLNVNLNNNQFEVELKKGQTLSLFTLGNRGFVDFKIVAIKEENGSATNVPPYRWYFTSGCFQDIAFYARNKTGSTTELQITNGPAPNNINITIEPDIP